MKKIKTILLSFILAFLLVFPLLTLAQTEGTNAPANTGSNCPDGQLCNPLQTDSVQELIGLVINSVLGVVGSLALLMFVYGGLTWMTSSGSQEKVKKGKDIIVWSALGLVIVFGAYGITRFIINITTGS
ncbi:MAG: pilin [Patescibacteria group bacterium]|jgi:hypothetical protein|nr:pilin [Patescibacteria group bacterium]